MVTMSRDDAILTAANVCRNRARELAKAPDRYSRDEAQRLALVYDVLLYGTKQANKVEQIKETRDLLAHGKF